MYSPSPKHTGIFKSLKPKPQATPPNVIVVEDVNLSANIAKSLLKRSGFTTVVANTGNEALSLYRKHGATIKLILMDINLPDMDGCYVTARIREYERQTELPHTIIYALTGSGGNENYDKYRQSGMNGCIIKGSLLRDTLEHHISQSRDDPKKFITCRANDTV